MAAYFKLRHTQWLEENHYELDGLFEEFIEYAFLVVS
jgi:hypothetical protein